MSTAAHDAAHIIVDVVRFGPEGVHAMLASMRRSAGRRQTLRPHARRHLIGTTTIAFRCSWPDAPGSICSVGRCRTAPADAGATVPIWRMLPPSRRRWSALSASPNGHPALPGRTDDTRQLLSYREVRSAANLEFMKADRAVRSLHREALEVLAATLFERGRIEGTKVTVIIDLGPEGRRLRHTGAPNEPRDPRQGIAVMSRS
ncbi:hypothetical protein ACVW1B_005352 [Bradyrhizobium sp. USDA 4502]